MPNVINSRIGRISTDVFGKLNLQWYQDNQYSKFRSISGKSRLELAKKAKRAGLEYLFIEHDRSNPIPVGDIR